MQSVAQNAHLSSPELVEVPFLQISLPRNPNRGVSATGSFNPSPFSQEPAHNLASAFFSTRITDTLTAPGELPVGLFVLTK
jgi:hypothetical protein